MVWTRSDGFYGDSDEHVYVATDGRIFYEQGGVGSIYETLDEFRNSLEWWATDHHFQIDEDLFREVEKAVDPFLTALRRSFCSEMAFGNDKQCVAGEKA